MRGAAFFGGDAPDSQAADASIGIDAEAHASGRGEHDFFFEDVQRMRAKRSAAQNFNAAFGFKLAAFGEIAFEVQRVDFDALDHAVGSQLDKAPVVMLAAAAAGFPTIVHAGRAAGKNQIVARAVKHVAGFDDAAAVFDRGEVDELAQRFRHHFAMNAQTGDASVGINVEAEVRVAMGIVDGEEVLRIAAQRRRRQNFGPRFLIGAGFDASIFRGNCQ